MRFVIKISRAAAPLKSMFESIIKKKFSEVQKMTILFSIHHLLALEMNFYLVAHMNMMNPTSSVKNALQYSSVNQK